MKDLIKALAKTSNSSIQVNSDDYIGDDGLIYCGKCHTPKQTRITYNGETVTAMCLCKCESDKRDEQEMLDKQRQRTEEIRSMRYDGFPDSEMQGWRFENDDQVNSQINIAKRYANNFSEFFKKHKGLLLFGGVGTGKTFMSACIANALIDKGIPCLVTNFARISNTLMGVYEKQTYIDSLNKYDLLVIDDLASERNTEYMNEVVMNVIDSRYRSGKPLIVTTNLTADELKNPRDISRKRIYSRLFEMCIPVEIKGYDRRKKKLIDEHDEFAQLLGLEEGSENNGIKQ